LLAITKISQVTEADRIASNIMILSDFHANTVTVIKSLIKREVKQANHAGSLMRANSMASKLMKVFSTVIGRPLLIATLGDQVKRICADEESSYEVDEVRLSEGENLEQNRERLKTVCSKILRCILDSTGDAPKEIFEICRYLQEKVTAKFPGSAQLCIGGFLFLRFFCPAIVTPHVCGIVPTSPSIKPQRGLVLCAQVLQNIANNQTYGAKEAFMTFMNEFISNNVSACQDYLDSMAILRDDARPANPRNISNETKSKSVEALYKQTKSIYPKIEEKYSKKAFFPQFKTLMGDIEAEQNTQHSSSEGDKARRDSTNSTTSVHETS